MTDLTQVYDPHGDTARIAALIRQRTHGQVSTEMCGSLAAEIMSIQIDQPERDHERALAAMAVRDSNRRADLAVVALSSDNHKRKMYFLERGVVGIVLQTVLGNIHERRGVFNLMAVTTFVLLIALIVQA